MDNNPRPEPDRGAARPQRVLACQLCQQRKIKCNRKFPCSNCVRSGAQCVPAALVPRQRRRRFPERELLARIRHYEGLLRQHGIHFEPLHPDHPVVVPGTTQASASPSRASSPAPVNTPQTTQSEVSAQDRPARPRATNLWQALSQKNLDLHDDSDEDDDEVDSVFLRDDDDVRGLVEDAWNRTYQNPQDSNQHLLFGSPMDRISLTTLHPDQARIFRLWQIYLDNVNPLLKVTHTPTLQARIVDALGDLSSISPPLEALLFSIYCVAIMSLTDDQSRALFGSPQKDLLSGYQFACRQALLNANILQSSDHDCLTALFLYLISIRPNTNPRALSSMLAVAIHLAQRMGYHSESKNEKCSVFEAEMHRRLWWALVMFANRICEVHSHRTPILTYTWDCNPPANINDFELLPDMKTHPSAHDGPTEAVFAVVRSRFGDLTRRCVFHLDFIDPFLSSSALAQAEHPTHGVGPWGARELAAARRSVEERTLAPYDPNNPLHYMTMWTARGLMAKSLLLEYCARQTAKTQTQQQDHPEEDPDPEPAHTGILHALTMLDADTHLMTSPVSARFHWYTQFHFPFLGYIYLAQHLRKRPPPPRREGNEAKGERQKEEGEGEEQDLARRAWEVMSANYEARQVDFAQFTHRPLFALFSRVVLQAWEAVRGEEEEVPGIVGQIREQLRMLGMAASAGGGGNSGVDEGGGWDAGVRGTGVALGRGAVDIAGGPGPVADMSGLRFGGDAMGGPALEAGNRQGYPDMLVGGGGLDFMEMDQFWPLTDLGFM